jgi:hypothetical protein
MLLQRCLIATAICLLLAGGAFAADVTGKWTAQVPGRGGQLNDSTFTFKVSGEQLTGSMTGPAGEIPLEEGKISGDNISFSTTLNFGGNSIKFLYKGVVQGNSIKFTRQRDGAGQTQEFTATKATT